MLEEVQKYVLIGQIKDDILENWDFIGVIIKGEIRFFVVFFCKLVKEKASDYIKLLLRERDEGF